MAEVAKDAVHCRGARAAVPALDRPGTAGVEAGALVFCHNALPFAVDSPELLVYTNRAWPLVRPVLSP
jgi:hypothetical protein